MKSKIDPAVRVQGEKTGGQPGNELDAELGEKAQADQALAFCVAVHVFYAVVQNGQGACDALQKFLPISGQPGSPSGFFK